MQNLQNEIDAKNLHELQKLDLFNEKTFYRAFIRDILEAKKEIVIYSPFVTKFRSEFFRKTLETLKRRNIALFIFTRPLEEHEYLMRAEIKCALKDYEEMGACIFYLQGSIHEKVAIIDRAILWEGSLNILSQRESKEMMKRMANEDMAMQVMSYLGLNEKLAEGYKFQYERLYRSLVENSRFNFKVKIKEFLTEIAVPKLAKIPFIVSRAIISLFQGIMVIIKLIILLSIKLLTRF
ncbi:MAG: hypothetical protein Q7S37_01170 [bacterium]|nr:hypothetical protein [bacterium]